MSEETIESDLTIAEAASRRGVSIKTIRRAISRGEIEAYRCGPRLIRISRASLAAWGTPLQYVGGGAA